MLRQDEDDRMTNASKLAAIAACALVAAIGSVAAEGRFEERAELEALSGVYASTAPEPWYGGWGTRRFSFERGRWALTFVHALDPEMKRQTFQFRTEGPYRVGAPSAAVPGAYEAVFGYDAKYVTLLTGDDAVARRFAGCGLRLNEEMDISGPGCANWKPVAACREDHDLVAIDRQGVYFGVRARDNDMCTADKRGRALLQPVARR